MRALLGVVSAQHRCAGRAIAVWSVAMLAASASSVGATADDTNPQTAFRALQLGYVALDAGDFSSALEMYDRARELAVGDTQRFNAELGYGTAALELGRLDEARAALEEARRLKPGEAGATMLLGVVCRRQGELERAVSFLAEAAVIDPEMPQALVELGIAYGAMGRHDSQERVNREALELDPDHLEARLGLAVALFHQEDAAAAVREFQEVLERDPENLRAHFGLGLALLYSGDRDGAIRKISYLNDRSPELAAELHGWVFPDD